MKPMSYEEAKDYYTPVVMAEVKRCDDIIEDILETINEIGEDEVLLELLKETRIEREVWLS